MFFDFSLQALFEEALTDHRQQTAEAAGSQGRGTHSTSNAIRGLVYRSKVLDIRRVRSPHGIFLTQRQKEQLGFWQECREEDWPKNI